jgi:DNA repair exonuclease SbcCD nuclease subunit
MRLIHTSDWQIGKTFGFADEAAQALRDERLEAVTRIGDLARAQGALTVLVAGDIYDVQTPLERTLRQPIERTRAFPDIAWHLVPGNHDPHTPRGPWDRLRRACDALPSNIHLHLDATPAPLAGGAAWLLPGVLTRRHAAGDPTAEMDDMATPEGAPRIGIAHGSVTSFGTDSSSTHNLIAADRPKRAGLAYMALGDWHGAQPVGDRCWYSGTHETDDFSTGGAGGGEALLVDIEGPAAPPTVTQHRTGRFTWHKLRVELFEPGDIDLLEQRLRGLAPGALGSALIWLTAGGALSLAARDVFEQRIVLGVGSAVRVLRLEDELLAQPTTADLEAIDHAGFLRVAAERLAVRAREGQGDEQDIAAAALQRLYILHMQQNPGERV